MYVYTQKISITNVTMLHALTIAIHYYEGMKIYFLLVKSGVSIFDTINTKVSVTTETCLSKNIK